MNKSLHSSQRTDWGTPQALFDALNAEFYFDLDACANYATAKCAWYYDGTSKRDGLISSWAWGHATFCNPPYGRAIGDWTRKAVREAASSNTRVPNKTVVILLIPARPDTRWWHELVTSPKCAEVRFIRGRVKFEGATAGAPFPSAIVVLREHDGECVYSYVKYEKECEGK